MAQQFPNSIPADLASPNAGAVRISGTLRCDFLNGRIRGRADSGPHRAGLLRRLAARGHRPADATAWPTVRT
jgi:hypothetical protein